MKYFESDGQRYRDVGVARPGSRARRTAVLSVAAVVLGTAVFALFFQAMMKEEGLGTVPILLIIAAVSILTIGVVVFLTRHQFGGGGVTIDMGTGVVELRDRTGSGLSRKRLERSNVREVTITRRLTDSGKKFTVWIASGIGDHVAGILDDDADAREFAGELSSLLSVPLRDRTSDRQTEEDGLRKATEILKRDHPLLFRLLGGFIERNRQ